jgi:prepilin-type N-terminal cleavage/methylation domain-containing protein/prepilin-type processing-associated H-X9-DG protein
MGMLRNSRSHNGFTLIELLVVIAIIAILAAILFPVFAQARAKARQTACLSNFKQVGTAMMMYTQDYDETYPVCNRAYKSAPGIGRYATWVMHLHPYLKNMDLYRCPDALKRGAESETTIIGLSDEQYVIPAHGNIGANEWVVMQQDPVAGHPPLKPVALAAVGRPAQMCLFGDSSFILIPAMERVMYASKSGSSYGGWPAPGQPGRIKPEWARHSGGSNVGFGDGHVKWYPQGALDADPERARRPDPNTDHYWSKIPLHPDDSRLR